MNVQSMNVQSMNQSINQEIVLMFKKKIFSLLPFCLYPDHWLDGGGEVRQHIEHARLKYQANKNTTHKTHDWSPFRWTVGWTNVSFMTR
jgi:hypothetical protein